MVIDRGNVAETKDGEWTCWYFKLIKQAYMGNYYTSKVNICLMFV